LCRRIKKVNYTNIFYTVHKAGGTTPVKLASEFTCCRFTACFK